MARPASAASALARLVSSTGTAQLGRASLRGVCSPRQASSSAESSAQSPPAADAQSPRREQHGSTGTRTTASNVHPRDRLRFARAVARPGGGPAELGEEGAEQHGSNLTGWAGSRDHPEEQEQRQRQTVEAGAEAEAGLLVPAYNGSSSSSSSDGAGEFHLPPPQAQPFPLPRVPFSTHAFVNKLEQADIPRPLANEVMSATLALLLSRELRARQELLSKQDIENEAYLFTAALAELKTGTEVKARNDNLMLGSMKSGLERETEILDQRVKEDVHRLQSDIQLDMNQRKEETSFDLKALDMKIMDLNSKFTILLGEVRTEIEASRWISTRRVMSAIVATVICVVAFFSAQPAKSKSESPPPPTLEELGVRGGPEEAEVNTGWSFWPAATASHPVVAGKRVGAEEEENE